jgi:hypothetical protein
MKRVNGGDGFGTCTANCPSGQSAGCVGYESCSYPTGDGGYDKGVDCTSGGTTIHVLCAAGRVPVQ